MLKKDLTLLNGAEASQDESADEEPDGEWSDVKGKESLQPTESSSNTKLKKKKQNKKKNKARKEFLKSYKERCVSKDYQKIVGKNHQAEIKLINLNPHQDLRKLLRPDKEKSSSNESSSDADSDEDLEDYQVEGYHPMSVK